VQDSLRLGASAVAQRSVTEESIEKISGNRTHRTFRGLLFSWREALCTNTRSERASTANDTAGNVAAGIAVDAARPPETEAEIDRR